MGHNIAHYSFIFANAHSAQHTWSLHIYLTLPRAIHRRQTRMLYMIKPNWRRVPYVSFRRDLLWFFRQGACHIVQLQQSCTQSETGVKFPLHKHTHSQPTELSASSKPTVSRTPQRRPAAHRVRRSRRRNVVWFVMCLCTSTLMVRRTPPLLLYTPMPLPLHCGERCDCISEVW